MRILNKLLARIKRPEPSAIKAEELSQAEAVFIGGDGPDSGAEISGLMTPIEDVAISQDAGDP